MHGPVTSILLADADEQRGSTLADHLQADGHTVSRARATREAELKLGAGPPALLLCGELDDPVAALALLGRVRAGELRTAGVPVDLPAIMLAPGGRLGVLRAFERGFDDVTSAADYLELRARIGALLRRARGRLGSGPVMVDGLEVDRSARTATVHGRPLRLARLQFELLARLAAEPRSVLSKRELLADVWQMPEGVRTRTLDATACRLRRTLAEAGAGRMVICCRGVGYSLCDPRPVAELGAVRRAA